MVEMCIVVVYCLMLNFFFGSGLFDFDKVGEYDVFVMFVIDVGGGMLFLMLQMMNEVYKVVWLLGYYLIVMWMFWFVMVGVVQVFDFVDMVGMFKLCIEVDFVVFDLQVMLLFVCCMKCVELFEELLFVFVLFGDDCVVYWIYVVGEFVYECGVVCCLVVV